MLKAVFFDIDGTLTSLKTKKIPESTYEALRQLQQRGIKIFIATGRHMIDVDQTPVKGLPFDGYVTLNGQICLDKDRKSFYHLPLDEEDVHHMVQLFEKKEFQMLIAEMDRKYINYLTENEGELGFPKSEIGIYSGNKVYQFMLRSNREKTKEIVADLKNSRAAYWPPDGTDIIPAAGGKMNGIKKTLEYYGIRREEMMAFGDGDNDKEMLAFAHIGVAMGDADEEIKQYADYVTVSVDEDGVLKALQHLHVL